LFFLFICSFLVDNFAGSIEVVRRDANPKARIPVFEELRVGFFELKWNFGFLEPIADGIAFAFVVACPYFLQTFVGEIASRN